MPSKNSNILIVDDNPENIKVLGAALALSKYEITIATNGEAALKATEEQTPDLMLLDVMMPGIDGFQVCERLKANPRTKDIEIIFLTAAVAHSDELKGLELGAVDYIHKPFSVPIVQAKVALHLERVRSKRELALKNAALEEVGRLREDIERMSRHDLKTPLNALLGYPQLMLLDNSLTDEQRGYLDEMLKAGNEMLHMINNSLDMFKMESGFYPYKPEPVEILFVLERVIRDLRMLIEPYGIKIKFQGDSLDNGFIVLAESNLSYSLFANLIRNAIEACPVNGTITITLAHENDVAIISITNPGTVPAAIRDTFFEKYATFGKVHGTGLGTYSAKLMTSTQNGTITMSTNHKETCISVRLPCANSLK
jgi:DNA-binding response OmpR family regulator